MDTQPLLLMNSRVSLFSDDTESLFVRAVPESEARRLILTGQAAPTTTRKGKKVRAIYLTGVGESQADPMSRVIKQPVVSERLGGSVGFVYAMRLRTSTGSITV